MINKKGKSLFSGINQKEKRKRFTKSFDTQNDIEIKNENSLRF